MEDTRYFGTYARIDTVSKREGSALVSADCIVGDLYSIDFQMDEGTPVAWLQNKFGKNVAFFEKAFSRQLLIIKERGWTIRALLSYVAFSDNSDKVGYWGEAAVICNNPSFDQEVDIFTRAVGRKIAEDVRPEIDLSQQGVDRLLENNGDWLPSANRPSLDKNKGTVYMKRHQSTSEKMIEQGRKGNKGCYAASIGFFVILAIIILLILKGCGVFG